MNQNVPTTKTVVKPPNKPSDNWKTAAAWGVSIAALGTAISILGTKMAENLSSQGK